MAAAMKICGLSLRFGQRLLLDRAEAEFERGRIMPIVGPSGPDKTTFLHATTRLAQQDGSQRFPIRGD